ncbi:hypothetical protein [Marinobacter sp. KMM 10035]|uniref:hypothetical protein n=1 Tax=Marinobacter sp. KMM 10035 TaxID=3134034 RepID=UPI003979B6CF
MIDLARETAEICIDMFGEPITFAGQPACGIVATELVELGGYDAVVESRLTVSVLVEEVPAIEKGQPVIARGNVHKVDQLMAGNDNPDLMVKVVLR